MFTIRTSARFRRDVKRCKKQKKDLLLFKEVDEKLTKGEPLLSKNCDHTLTGNWHGHRDCHIAPDWLLIYRIFEKEQEIEYVRMGSHAELFG